MLLFFKKPNLALRFFCFVALVIFGMASIIGSNEGSTPGTSSPNPNYVVFLADKDENGTTELYAYSLQARGVTKLNSQLASGGDVTSYSISPDGLWVAYVAVQDTDERFELYVAKPDGSSVTKVSDPAVNLASDVDDDPLWSPDSSRIAYRSTETDRTGGVFVLRTVRPDGSNNVIINPQGIVGSSSVAPTSFAWAPDSFRIAYLSNQDDTLKIELYTSAANSASNNGKVNGTLPLGGNVTQYGWAPNGSKIAYRADQANDEVYELWTATPTGGSNTRISDIYGTSERDVLDSFAWAPDSSRIAYIADEISNDVFELFTVQPDGSGRLKVSANITVTGADVFGVPSWAPDSSRIAYVADLNADEVYELYTSQPTVATSSIKVNGTLRGGNVLTGPLPGATPGENSITGAPPAWSPNSVAIAYIAQQNTTGVNEVYVGKGDGTGNVKVSGTLTVNNTVSLSRYDEVWAPDGSRLMYMADQLSQGTQDLFTTIPTDNANIARITNTPVQADSLKSFGKWSPDGSYIAYVSAQDTADVDELYMNTPTGGNNHNISGALVFEGDVDRTGFSWGPLF